MSAPLYVCGCLRLRCSSHASRQLWKFQVPSYATAIVFAYTRKLENGTEEIRTQVYSAPIQNEQTLQQLILYACQIIRSYPKPLKLCGTDVPVSALILEDSLSICCEFLLDEQ